MNLLNMASRAINAKFQPNISKITSARPKKHTTWGVNIPL